MRRPGVLTSGLVVVLAATVVVALLSRGGSDEQREAHVAPEVPADGDQSDQDAEQSATSGVVHLVVDPAVQPSVTTLAGRDGPATRMVVAAVGPDGRQLAYVADELVVRADGERLSALAAELGGEVLDDGYALLVDGGVEPRDVPDQWGLLRLPTGPPDLDAAAVALAAAGLDGTWRLSSPAAAQALAAAAGVDDASPNLLGELPGLPEHPGDSGVPIDLSTEWYMREDGAGAGIVRAWEYVKYTGYPIAGASMTPVTLAHLDTGFDLDEQTGLPTLISGGHDYGPSRPAQLDEVGMDTTAGGHGVGFSNCNSADCWHGQQTWAVGAAVARNGYGIAGTSGGGQVRPLLVRINADMWTIARGIRDALANHADVITIDYARPCDWGCRFFEDGDVLVAATDAAVTAGAVVLATAGNRRIDISDRGVVPCAVDGVICVGGVTEQGRRDPGSNWGAPVDIWAPWKVLSGPTRVSADSDAEAADDDIGRDELLYAAGTCTSTPFVAGIASLLRMLDTDLTSDAVRDVLRATATASDDPVVTPGVVDAFATVRVVRSNQPPVLNLTSPADGEAIGLEGTVVRVEVTDPERPSPFWGLVTYTSTLDVLLDDTGDGGRPLCSAGADVTSPGGGALSCAVTGLDEGTHTLVVQVTDPFGARTTATVTVRVRNAAPAASIRRPVDGAVVTAGAPVELRGLGFDPDEELPGSALSWRSDLAGPLGVGRSLDVVLSAGTHEITLSVVDSRGATAQDRVRVTVVDPAGRPTIEILEPEDGRSVATGAALTLVAHASDPEDGELGDAAITWSSDLDGPLGGGRRLVWTPSGSTCGVTEHQVTATATDTDRNAATAVVTVRVGTLC